MVSYDTGAFDPGGVWSLGKKAVGITAFFYLSGQRLLRRRIPRSDTEEPF